MLFVVVAGALNVVLATVFAVAALRKAPVEFLREDGPLENLTAGLYLVGFVLAVRGARVTEPARRWVALSVAVLAALFALEELSYGERFFDFPVPTVLGIRFDAAHDVLDIGVEFIGLGSSERPLINVVLAVLLAGLAVGAAWRFRSVITAWIARSWRDAAAPFVVISFGLNLFAAVADLGGQLSRAVVLMEESAEATASLAIVFAALTFLRRWSPARRGRAPA